MVVGGVLVSEKSSPLSATCFPLEVAGTVVLEVEDTPLVGVLFEEEE
jgi:hypothetical protein